MHYYNFNIGDYRKDTSHLIPIEHYIYRTLIDWYYLDENPIPKETQVVLRRLSLGIEHEKNLLNVFQDFFKLTEKGWEHGRIKVEINDYHEMVLKNKSNGKLGGRPKKTQSVSSGMPEESQNNPSVTLTKNQEPITNNQKLLDYKFDQFWESYPKKVGKEAARKSWKKAKPNLEDVLNALEWQITSEQWRKEAGQFIPNPATYINQGRWQDEKPSESAINPSVKPWYIVAREIEAKGREKGMEIGRDEQIPAFLTRIRLAFGITPEMVRKAQIDWEEK